MIRTNGLKTKYKPLEVVSEVDNIYIVRWDYAEIREFDPETEEYVDTDMAVWAEEILYHKPTENEMRRMVNDYYNNITGNKILQGFYWNDMLVWLSEENQRNYKSTYDLAIQTGGTNLPVEFKFGTEDLPVYQVFHTIEELQKFYIPMQEYIQQCITDGWRMKDSVDYSLYEVTDKEESSHDD